MFVFCSLYWNFNLKKLLKIGYHVYFDCLDIHRPQVCYYSSVRMVDIFCCQFCNIRDTYRDRVETATQDI